MAVKIKRKKHQENIEKVKPDLMKNQQFFFSKQRQPYSKFST